MGKGVDDDEEAEDDGGKPDRSAAAVVQQQYAANRRQQRQPREQESAAIEAARRRPADDQAQREGPQRAFMVGGQGREQAAHQAVGERSRHGGTRVEPAPAGPGENARGALLNELPPPRSPAR